jgi:TolA-binding protein
MSMPASQETGASRAQPARTGAVEPFVIQRRVSFHPLIAVALVTVSACSSAGSGRPTTPQRQSIQMEELRITAKRGAQGYEFDAYDASDLFTQATDLLNKKQCREAVVLYDRVAKEFADGEYASASLYNAGLCLQALGDFAPSADHYAALRERYPDSPDRRDASFQLAEVLVQLSRWTEAQAVADELLARTDLSSDERLEAMARRAQALLGLEQFDQAESYARGALSFYHTRPADDPIKDDFFAAACNYVLAETFRQREQAMSFPEGLEPQKQVLLRRAELLLDAQREYFNTISLNNLDNYHWAAASGYRIGGMYDELWHAIMAAPVPKTLPPEGHAIYHDALASLIKPLIRHAIRYWELTQMFIERTGIQTPWAEKIKTDLDRVRSLLLQQPPGPGGVPATTPQPATPPTATPTSPPST